MVSSPSLEQNQRVRLENALAFFHNPQDTPFNREPRGNYFPLRVFILDTDQACPRDFDLRSCSQGVELRRLKLFRSRNRRISRLLERLCGNNLFMPEMICPL